MPAASRRFLGNAPEGFRRAHTGLMAKLDLYAIWLGGYKHDSLSGAVSLLRLTRAERRPLPNPPLIVIPV